MISCPDAHRTIQTVESVHQNSSLNSQFFLKLTVPPLFKDASSLYN